VRSSRASDTTSSTHSSDPQSEAPSRLLAPEFVARHFPEFVPHWQLILGQLGADAWSPGFVCQALTNLAASRFGVLGDEGLIQTLFAFAERVLAEGTQAEQDAISTQFLENLINSGSAGCFDLDYMVPYLGPLSAAYCRAWDAFNGVRTPGLWPPGVGPGLDQKRRHRKAKRRHLDGCALRPLPSGRRRSTPIIQHYATTWGSNYRVRRWPKGPVEDLGDFRVVEFRVPALPGSVYATDGMRRAAAAGGEYGLELCLTVAAPDAGHVELLTAIAHFHLTGEALDLGHTIRFGRPLAPGSRLTHGFISLPYLWGPTLEQFSEDCRPTRVLWLVPITEAERLFLMENGVDALEEELEARNFNYLDPHRPSVV
jgi:hypothetical protein